MNPISRLRGGLLKFNTQVILDSPVESVDDSIQPEVESPKSPKVRKEFPETWIWDDVNEEGFV